ncbi:unnamed protein product, partial [Prorocentrum cordatum]
MRADGKSDEYFAAAAIRLVYFFKESTSTGTSGERELLPLEPAVREAVSDVAAAQFEQFRRLREVYLQHRARAGRRRAELANRARSSRRPEVGDMVLFKDPKLSKAVAGHAPGRRPLRGPFEVLSTKGNVATLRDPETQQVLKDVHGDFLVGVPGLVDDTERIVKLEEDDGRGRASAGQLLAARLAPGGGEAAEALAPRVKARMREVKVGRLVAYQGEEAKRCRVGKVLSLAEDLSSVTVHVYQAAVDGRLQVVWTAAYDRQEGADFQRQRVETLEAKQVLGVVELNKGVLNHSAASRLARAGWRLDEGAVRHGALAAAAVTPAAPRLSDLPSSRVIALVAACRPLEELDLKIGEVQAWAHGAPLFVEIFDGVGRLSQAVRSLGAANAVCSVVAGIDLKRRTYGQYWDLSRAKDRARLRYLLFEVLRPAGAHWALPCAKWSSLGGHQPDANAHALASFTMDGLEHFDGAGCLASFEGPRAHALVASVEWQQRFGSAEAPRGRWRYVLPDGCMFHCRSPDEEPLAMQKPCVIVGNFPLDLLDVQCRRGALRPLGRGLEGVGVASAELGSVAGSSMIGAARALEGPRMPCEPGRAAAPAAGATRSVDKLSDAEMAEKKARREPAAAAAKKKWAELAKKGDWDQVRMPGKCFRFAEVKVSPRRSAEYKAKVLEAVGLVGECAGYKHLGSQELEALKEMISLKAEAFWVKGTARTVMRGFKHDVVTTGLLVRGPPIRLKGPEASIVREELEAGVEQGLYSRGTSPWGSWAFPTKEHASGRRRRTVVDYRMVNRRMVMFVYYIRRCRDVKGELVGCAFISGMDGARGFNLLVNTEHAKEVLAVLADCGCYLPEVLQLGPATGPFDFQFCTDELFTGTGRGRYGSVWKNYIDDFWVRTGQWLNGRAYTDREHEEMLAAASPPPAASRPLGDSLAAAGFAGTRKASQSYDHAKGVLVGLCVAQSATGAAAMDGGGVALANGLRMLVVAAAVRTASLMDEGLRAGVQLTQDIFEAAGDLVQSVSWNLSGLIHEVCEGAVLVVRVLVVVQCCYALYCLRSWVACRSQRAALERAATAGEAAQRGLTSSARACEAGDGPAFGREPMARAAAAGRSPGGALSSADGAASPVVALWREAEFETPLLGAAARPRAEVLQIQRSAAVALRDLEHSDRQRAARARDLAACGAVVSAKLVEAARSSAVKDAGDLCEFEVEVAGSRGVRYDVRLRAGRSAAALLPASCTCADFVGGVGSPCKHIGAAWCCAVDGNFSELVELALAAGRKEGAATGPQRRAALAPSDSLGLAGAVRELRDSEAEVVRLREEVQQLQAQLGATSRREAVTEFLSASETLAAWARACGEAESYVYVACFTFDQPGVVNYLEAARARGLTVRLVFSGRDKALTNNQGPRLQRLRACGCEVRAHKGSRLHAKVMMTEREIVLGSCNFTTASLGNVERGASLQELSEETVLEQKEWFEQLFEAAAPFKDGIGRLARGRAAVAPRRDALEARRARGSAAAARGAGGHLGERPSGRGAEMAGARHFAAPSTSGSAGSYERLHGAEFGDFEEFIDFIFVERHVVEDVPGRLCRGDRSRSRSRGRSRSGSGDRDQRKKPEDYGVDTMKITDDDAAFILGKGGKTKEKIARVSQCEIELFERDLILELRGSKMERRRAKKYAEGVMAQRTGPVTITEDYDDGDLTMLMVPQEAVGFVTGRAGNFLRSIEEEWKTLMFFCEVDGSKGRGREYEKLAIFGDVRARRGAELKVLSAVETKVPGYLDKIKDDVVNRDRGKDSTGTWGTDTMVFQDDELSYALGKQGGTRKKLERSSGAIVQYVGSVAMFSGTKAERRRAKEYMKWLFEQLEGPVWVDGWEDRDDITVVEVPSDCIGYITGNRRATLGAMEEEWGTLMFFMNKAEDKGRGRGGSEKLAIFGSERARRGSELKVMSGVETKSPGFFTRGIREKTSDRKGFDTDRIIFKDDELSYALGKEGATRKKLELASGAVLQYVGHVAFCAGDLKERKRCKEFINWLLAQRRGSVTIPDVSRREDCTEMHVPENCKGWVTGNRGSELRRMEQETGTFMFMALDARGEERLLIFGSDPGTKTEPRGRMAAERLVNEMIQ